LSLTICFCTVELTSSVLFTSLPPSVYFRALQGSSVEQEEEQQPVEEGKEKEKAEDQPEPLWQLITAFSRSATTEATLILEADFLYMSYANIMAQVSRRSVRR